MQLIMEKNIFKNKMNWILIKYIFIFKEIIWFIIIFYVNEI